MINGILKSLTFLAVSMCMLTTGSAGEPGHKLFGLRVPDCVGMWFCDDYCPKREPCVRVPLCSTCDDYCPKQEPCAGAPICFSCDDYCKKCLPKVCAPACYGNSQCGENGGCDGNGCDGCSCDGIPVDVEIAETSAHALARHQTAVKSEEVEELVTENPIRLPRVLVGQQPFRITE